MILYYTDYTYLKDRNNTNNCRGISVLNRGYKIFTKIINAKLKIIADAVLLEEQQGFQRGRFTIDDVFTL
jgi:hypothetical protein